MTYRLAFTIPGFPKIMSNGSHGHWQTAYALKKKWRNQVSSFAVHMRPKHPLLKAKITLTRRSAREPDYDNLVSSFKPVIDGLKDAGVIADDSREHIGVPTYSWERAGPKSGSISILVEEVTETAVLKRGEA